MLIIGRSFIPHGAILVSSVLYLRESSGNVRGMRNLETENVTENNRRLLNVLDFFLSNSFLDLFICCLYSAFYKIISHYIFLIFFDNDTNLVKMYRTHVKTQQNHL